MKTVMQVIFCELHATLESIHLTVLGAAARVGVLAIALWSTACVLVLCSLLCSCTVLFTVFWTVFQSLRCLSGYHCVALL